MWLLLDAIVRLAPIAAAPLSGPLDPEQLLAYISSVITMAYMEGYRGFQKGFSPRVIARALTLQPRSPLHHHLLAPLYCMGMLHATRRRLLGTWMLMLGIVGLVLILRTVPQPWRGVVDAGVVVGLSWGAVSIALYGIAAALGRPPRIAADIPQ